MNVESFLFAKTAVFAFVKFATEAFLYLDIEFLAQWLVFDLVDDLSHEGVLQQGACFGLGDATLTHIEERCLVHHTDCGTVGAFHVVGIDFEHGLGVHAGFFAGAEIGVGFL